MKVYIKLHRVGDGFIGRLIGWFTFGKYKHASMAFREDNGHVRGFQSNAKHGVHFFDFVENEPNTDLFLVPCNDEQAYAMLHAAKSIVGAKYDYAGLWGFVRRKKRENPNWWFCSEAATWVCAQGTVILLRLPFYKQSPVLLGASTVLIPED